MTSRSVHQASSQDILALITEFYCGLTIKKSMQNISSEIRQFVMMNQKVKNKEQVAKKILDFFLKIQGKLTNKTQKQWDHAFQICTARGQALLKICEFPIRNLLIHSFKLIKNSTKYEHQSERKTMFSYRTEQPVQQYSNIQVQKEVKIKTLYFFKWCQYIQKSRALRQLKNREVENQKISLSFNKYGLKFNYFTAWKKLYKKYKTQRQKAKIISNKYKSSLMKKCMSVVLELSSIVAVEYQISKKISQKLIECQKKKLYKKLRMNNQVIKNQIKYKKLNSIKAFQFLQMFKGRFKPLMNRSFQLSRQKFQKQLQKAISHKYFNEFVRFNKDRKDKLQKLLSYRKNSLFLFWRNKYHQQNCFVNKEAHISSYLLNTRRNMVITILKFNKLVREQQFNKLQSMKENPLTNRSFIQVSIRKQNEEKRKRVKQYLILKMSQCFIKKLDNYRESCGKRIVNINNSRIVILKRMLSRYALGKNSQLQKENYYKKLSKKHQKKMLLSSFKSWRKIKYYYKVQQAHLKTIDKYYKKIAIKLFWNKFVFRVKEKQCIAKLVDASNMAIMKLSYLRILGKTSVINQKMKTIKQEKDKKLIRNLFDLLTKNQKYNAQKALNIQRYQMKRCERILIKKLKQKLNFKNEAIKASQLIQKRRKIAFLKRLNEQNYQIKSLVQKTEKVSKSTFLKAFKKSVQKSIQLEQYISSKSEQIQFRLKQLSMYKFIRQLKYNKSSRQCISMKKNRVSFKISKNSINKLKLFCQRIKNEKKLRNQQKLIIKMRIVDSIKLMGIQNKFQNLKASQGQRKFHSALTDFKQLCSKSAKIKQCSFKLQQKLLIKRASQFYKCMIKQKQETEQKIKNIQESQTKNEKTKLKYFYTLLRNNKENILNYDKLCLKRKNKQFTQFVALNLKCKFSKIKFNCSLKFYAKNLMKKALKSLKYVHMKIKQKQNLQKLDRNSSMLIEKSIEKSFKSNTLSQQIQRFNLRKSRQIR